MSRNFSTEMAARLRSEMRRRDPLCAEAADWIEELARDRDALIEALSEIVTDPYSGVTIGALERARNALSRATGGGND